MWDCGKKAIYAFLSEITKGACSGWGLQGGGRRFASRTRPLHNKKIKRWKTKKYCFLLDSHCESEDHSAEFYSAMLLK
ncbi:hypothetical protein BJI48_02855 [Helicobacter sp. 11S02596-1]|nr:hypothetical protein BJI48_02855 [Helicobacter sp. 11S02596-1]